MGFSGRRPPIAWSADRQRIVQSSTGSAPATPWTISSTEPAGAAISVVSKYLFRVVRILFFVICMLGLLISLVGVGASSSSTEPKVTVIATSCGVQKNTNLRYNWLLVTLRTYLTVEYDEVIDRILVVWNTDEAVDSRLAEMAQERLLVVETGSNSLNNRWIRTLDLVRTELVLNVDDDVIALKPAIQCFIRAARKDFLVGPFVRRISHRFEYSMSECLTSRESEYSIVLPRVMLLHRSNMEAYANASSHILEYIDREPAMSDDMLLNFLNPRNFRVVPPQSTIVDYDKLCGRRHSDQVGGLSRNINRTIDRSNAARYIGLYYGERFQNRRDTWRCDARHRGGDTIVIPRPVEDFRELYGALASMLPPTLRHGGRFLIDNLCNLA